jgi:hypothetical protein
MFLIDSIDSPLIQSLIADPEIHIFDFKLADAYTKRLPFLEKLVIPPEHWTCSGSTRPGTLIFWDPR